MTGMLRCAVSEGAAKNNRVIEMRKDLTYTVDEISAMLDVPRPTLYRYLKEYSVPYARRSGRILIPEESLGRIRKVRELHDEGLGAEAVRRRLTDGASALEEKRLGERLDRICEALEDLRGAGGNAPAEIAAPSGAMRTLLARQNLLISAVFDMSEILEELLAASGLPRRTTFQDALSAETPGDRAGDPGTARDTTRRLLAARTIPGRVIDAAPSGGGERFGVLARRRRRVAATVLALAILAVIIALAWGFTAYGGA